MWHVLHAQATYHSYTVTAEAVLAGFSSASSPRASFIMYTLSLSQTCLSPHPPSRGTITNRPTHLTRAHIARLIDVVIRGQFRGCLGTTPSPNAAIIKLGIYIYLYV